MPINNTTLESLCDKYELSYHVPYLLNCHQTINLNGKKVLEVGGCLPPELTINLLGCQGWFALEARDYDDELGDANQIHRISEKSEFCGNFTHAFMNIEELGDEHDDAYDVVFSIAAFEHIARFPEALAKMYKVLKPGGILFSMFSPIWSAHDGHHLPSVTTKSGNKIGFGSPEIPPWGHLLMNRPEMRDHLLHSSVDLDAANEIIYYIYNSPHINRYFAEDYIYFVEQSPFTPIAIDLTFPKDLPREIGEALRRRFPGRSSFSNNGLRLVLQKEQGLTSMLSPGDAVCF